MKSTILLTAVLVFALATTFVEGFPGIGIHIPLYMGSDNWLNRIIKGFTIPG
ncbi:hypothetical protein OESDEN_12845 [Oesophagostomum dentatum]|uniref:Uncharacterized protein n=1 Tax=Oesophagostomum dentatum TaxID=61180 RepID=A0A0B1SPX4_OESDE|nr:hypothetical protein OESDEN_12845 [Oesophagostomum dentatum]